MHTVTAASGATLGPIGQFDLTFMLETNSSQIGLSFCKAYAEILS